MNSLEKIYKNISTGTTVCIKYKDGKVERVKEAKAYSLVKEGLASYISRTEYRNLTKTKKVEVVSVVETEDQMVHRKRKEIRTDDKNQFKK